MKSLVPAIFATLFIVGTAAAQFNTTGLYLRPQLSAASWTADDFSDDERENGFGVGLTIGYGFNEMLSVFLDGNAVSMTPTDDDAESYALAHFDLGVQGTFGADKFKPYGLVALNARAAGQDDTEIGDVWMTGVGFTMGGGVLLFLSGKVAADVGIRYTMGSFTEIEIDGETFKLKDLEIDDISAKSLRLNVGISYFF